jgi:tetratricopeptide (TPR) repeat protein
MALAAAPNLQMHMNRDREKAAKEAIQMAINLSANSPEIEQEYISILGKKFANHLNNDDLNKLKLEYSQNLGRLSKRYPDDPDAAVLFAASLLGLQEEYWKEDGTPFPGIQEAVDTLQNTMKKYPNHVGANHYYIHVMDGSPYPEKALRAADRLQTLLPTAGHLVHMPSHIYILVGEYHKAVLCSEEALAADREYVNAYGIEGSYPRDYITHTLYFLTRAYSLEERFADAKWAADKARSYYLPASQQMPKMEYFAVMPLFVLVRFQDWKEILKFSKPDENMLLANMLWHFSRALAFANLKDAVKASIEYSSFEKSKEQVLENELFKDEKIEKMATIMGYFIEAKIAENENRIVDAIKLLQQAINKQMTLPYNESPIWFFSARQYLGALFLRLGQYKEAEQLFREDLDKIPNNSRSLFGLKESLSAQSNFYNLYWVNKAFLQAFKYSDINLTTNNL